MGQRNRDSRQLAGSVRVKGAAAEALHQFRDMLAAVRRSAAIGGEFRRWHCDLLGDESHHLGWRYLTNVEDAAGKTHPTQQQGEPEPIGACALLVDEIEIGRAQRVMLDDPPLIGSPRPERCQLLVGKEAAASHRLSFSNYSLFGTKSGPRFTGVFDHCG